MTDSKITKILNTLISIDINSLDQRIENEFIKTAKLCKCKVWEVEQLDKKYYLLEGKLINRYNIKRFELTTLYVSWSGYGWRHSGAFDTINELENHLFNIPHIIQDFSIYDNND